MAAALRKSKSKAPGTWKPDYEKVKAAPRNPEMEEEYTPRMEEA